MQRKAPLTECQSQQDWETPLWLVLKDSGWWCHRMDDWEGWEFLTHPVVFHPRLLWPIRKELTAEGCPHHRPSRKHSCARLLIAVFCCQGKQTSRFHDWFMISLKVMLLLSHTTLVRRGRRTFASGCHCSTRLASPAVSGLMLCCLLYALLRCHGLFNVLWQWWLLTDF